MSRRTAAEGRARTTLRGWLRRVAFGLGLLGFAVAVWFGAPLAAYGEIRPFERIWPRALVIGVVFFVLACVYGYRAWRRHQAQAALEAALAASGGEDSDARILGERMTESLDTLKRSSGRRTFLYDLPWYVIIGPPGVGKTTALVNSGLRFPLAAAGGAEPLAGVGGTRYCDWWFTEEAVLIDTAGRYTTHDSDAEADKKSWLAFLTLLKANRPKQPINGVIIAISLEDLMQGDGQEIGTHATAIRKRLLEIHEQLRVDFPVYALFTKADLIAGFAEYFGSFPESRRRKVWGATFQTLDRKKNMVGEVPAEFDALVRRLTEESSDRLQEEADPISRIAIFGFPAQFATLKDQVTDFLNRIFEPTRYQANANLRGFYFSSGTQEGTPIDRVLGAIARSFDQTAHASQLSGRGRSFFLHDLFAKVIFAEAGWVSLDLTAVRRAALLRYGSIGAIVLVAAVLLGVWGVSYTSNQALIASVDNGVEQYRVAADEELKRTSINDTNIETIIGNLDILRNLPVGYDTRDASTPLAETAGLSQRGRLLSASLIAYRRALERMYRSRLILQLERTIEANLDDPLNLYEPLKVYMMIGGKAPKADDELILMRMRQDWAENLYPGPANRAGREALERHLRALLALDDAYDPIFELNGPLIENAQRSLARMSMADRAYALLKSGAYAANIEDFSLALRSGRDAKLVFETVDGTDLDSLVIPGLYTYAGFNDFFLAELSTVAERLENERWVMGAAGEQTAVADQFKRLGPELLDRYAKEFVPAWTTMLDNLKFKRLSEEEPYSALAAATSPASPIKLLLEAVDKETALTREQPGAESETTAAGGSTEPSLAKEVGTILASRAANRASGLSRIGIDLAIRKSQTRLGGGGGASSASAQLPGANIEAQFKAYQAVVEGETGKRAVDELIANFAEVYHSLVVASTNASQSDAADTNMRTQLGYLRNNASRFPPPITRMVNAAIEEFEKGSTDRSLTQLNQFLTSTVTRPCERLIANRYPFARDSARDVAMGDFAKLFGPDGLFDRFFAQYLSDLVDISGSTWTWQTQNPLGRELSKATLRQFQRASEIRDAFFPNGGATPAVTVGISTFSLHGSVEMALLNIDGQTIQSQQVGSLPVRVQWPGGAGIGSASLSLTPAMPGRESAMAYNGAWGFMRLLDAGAVARKGEELQVRFVIGGRDVSYGLQVGSIANPFLLPALSEFSCPSGL